MNPSDWPLTPGPVVNAVAKAQVLHQTRLYDGEGERLVNLVADTLRAIPIGAGLADYVLVWYAQAAVAVLLADGTLTVKEDQ